MRIFAWLVAAAALVTLGYVVGSRSEPPTGAPPRSEWPTRIGDALTQDDRLAQASELAPVLDVLSPDDKDVVVSAFEAHFADAGAPPLPTQLLMEAWARIDPLDAYEQIRGWPTDVRRQALPALLRAWARTDPQTALEALEEIRDPTVAKDALPEFVSGWVESGDPSLWPFLAAYEPERAREELTLLVMHKQLQRKGVSGLLLTVEQLPEEPPLDDFKRRAFRSALSAAARVDGPAAAAFVERHRGGPFDERLMRRVAVHWVTADGTAAMNWARAQPAGEERDRVVRETFRRWLVRDRPAALTWMGDAGDRGDLASILDMYASALARQDPHAAIAWVEAEIEDPEAQREALLDVAQVWLHADRESATEWIEERGLGEDLAGIRAKRRARAGKRPTPAPAAEAQDPDVDASS